MNRDSEEALNVVGRESFPQGTVGHNDVINNILCHHDNNLCPLLTTLYENTESRLYSKEQISEVARGFTPCEYCPRLINQQCEKLSGVRLGKLERRALLLAPHEDDSNLILTPIDDSRAADEANRRAINKLAKLGLLFAGWNWETHEVRNKGSYHIIKRDYRKRAIWVTPLGRVVRETFYKQLSEGKPIRWNEFIHSKHGFTETEDELLIRLGKTCKDKARYYTCGNKMLYINQLVNELSNNKNT
ncbi:hypothetical protein [Paenibacillus sp. FSL H3-0286]|uniref:hypothetical protein n=1 Tax=Paenibacillus sp. FSL H3-0286 TaxID=2921427 RepID=UPI003248DB89